MESAVSFDTPTRVHVGIGVSNLEASLPFYRVLFDQEPTKVREGYAKFEVANPPVNFTLNETEHAGTPSMGPQHFGIQVKSTEAVHVARERFKAHGLETIEEDGVTCCYARSDKVWAIDPDGHRWEVFVVTDADAPVHSVAKVEATAEEPCCAPSCCK
jgi:catechol 2,3-dioxygenase-like lactoylglutathione lyase family enzyme